MIEVISFGQALRLFKLLYDKDQKSIAKDYGMPRAVFESWFHSLLVMRNICAHHSRLWNRALRAKPKIPNKWKETDDDVKPNRIFIMLIILRYLMRIIAPASAWESRLDNHLNDFDIDLIRYTHIPDNWQSHPLWLQPPTY